MTIVRVVRTNPPTQADFTSNQARGAAPRGAEVQQPELHSGLSVHDNARTAVETALRFRQIGGYLAVVRVSVGGTTRLSKTLGAGHYTLWGDPAALLAAVVAVVPVEPAGEGS